MDDDKTTPAPFTLSAAPVQQGLFSPTSYDSKPKPRERTLADDSRQIDMLSPKDKP